MLLESRNGAFHIGETHHFEYWEIGYWKLALLSALLPARQLLPYLQKRANARAGLCRSCAYNLRATPDRCPEWDASSS